MNDAVQNPTIHPAKLLLERLFIKIENKSNNGISELPDGTRVIRFKSPNIEESVKKSQNFVNILHSARIIGESNPIDEESLRKGVKIITNKSEFEIKMVDDHVEAKFKLKMLFVIDTDKLGKDVRLLEQQANNQPQNYKDPHTQDSHTIAVKKELDNLFNEYADTVRTRGEPLSGPQYIVRHPIKDNAQNTQILVEALKKAGFIDSAPEIDKVITSDFKKANISNDKSTLKINIVKKAPTEGDIVVDFTTKDARTIDITTLKEAVDTAKCKLQEQQENYNKRSSDGCDYIKDKLATLMSTISKSASPDRKVITSIKSCQKSFSMTFTGSEDSFKPEEIAQKLLERFKNGSFISNEELSHLKPVNMDEGFKIDNDKCALSGKLEAGKLTVEFTPKEKLYRVLIDIQNAVSEKGPATKNHLSDNGNSPSLSI